VTSRKKPPWLVWGPFAATLALTCAVGCGPLRAQEAQEAQEIDQSPLQLRAGDQAESTLAAPSDQADSTLAAPSDQTVAGGDAASTSEAKTAKDDAKKRKPAKRPPGRLPDLQPYPKADRAGLKGGPPSEDPNLVPAPTIAALPTPPPKRKPKPDDNPFDPTGVMVGDLRLTPFAEEDLGYSTNPNFVAGPTRGSLFETTDVGLGLQSDWSRDDLHASLHGGYTDFFSVPQANTPDASGSIGGRLDVSRDLSFDAEGRFLVATQLPGSVSLPTGVVLGTNQRPLVETFGATVGGVQKFGDLSVSLHGSLDRTSYQNATLADGSIDDLASDDFNDWALRGRIAYQISPIVSPFVESVIDTRLYDDKVDSSGYARTSDGVLGRAGVTLALTDKLTGEVSAGYGERHYQDARLPILAAPLFDASLVWTATALTKVTLKASTALADTTIPGASGAVSRVYSIDITHALRRYLTLGVNASFETDVYAGFPQTDTISNIALRADYNVTRDIMLRASVSRQQYESNIPGSNYMADVFMLGLKLMR
jgi:hypothetical protein